MPPPGRRVLEHPLRIRLVFGFLVLLHLAHGQPLRHPANHLRAAQPGPFVQDGPDRHTGGIERDPSVAAPSWPDAYWAGGTNEVKAPITAETWPSDSAGYIGSDTTSAHTRSPTGHIAGLVDESAGCLGMGTG